MWPTLRLTDYEKRFNDYCDQPDGRRGVIPYSEGATVQLTAGKTVQQITFLQSQRSRIPCITWSGDVQAMRVKITTSDGRLYVVDPVHIPLLSGHAPFSTLDIGGPYSSYPTVQLTSFAQLREGQPFIEDPNIVLPGNQQITLEYSLENPNDPALQGNFPITYTVEQCIHAWLFPGFEGGA